MLSGEERRQRSLLPRWWGPADLARTESLDSVESLSPTLCGPRSPPPPSVLRGEIAALKREMEDDARNVSVHTRTTRQASKVAPRTPANGADRVPAAYGAGEFGDQEHDRSSSREHEQRPEDAGEDARNHLLENSRLKLHNRSSSHEHERRREESLRALELENQELRRTCEIMVESHSRCMQALRDHQKRGEVLHQSNRQLQEECSQTQERLNLLQERTARQSAQMTVIFPTRCRFGPELFSEYTGYFGTPQRARACKNKALEAARRGR